MDDSKPANEPGLTTIEPRRLPDWLLLGFFVLILALSSLIALMILIAYQNGT
jgi:hypothetical protein